MNLVNNVTFYTNTICNYISIVVSILSISEIGWYKIMKEVSIILDMVPFMISSILWISVPCQFTKFIEGLLLIDPHDDLNLSLLYLFVFILYLYGQILKVTFVLIMLTCRDLLKLSFIQICHQENKILADIIWGNRSFITLLIYLSSIGT